MPVYNKKTWIKKGTAKQTDEQRNTLREIIDNFPSGCVMAELPRGAKSMRVEVVAHIAPDGKFI